MEQKEFERIARLEAQVEGVAESVSRIETKLDAYTTNFMPRKEAELRFQNVEKELADVKTDMDQQDGNRRSNIALVISIVSVVTGVIFSVINLLN